MSTRQFAVRCATSNGPSSASSGFDDMRGSRPTTEELKAELVARGLQEVVIVPDAQGDGLTIRGLAPAESREAARAFVQDQIRDATPDLIILEPGVWVDEGIRRWS